MPECPRTSLVVPLFNSRYRLDAEETSDDSLARGLSVTAEIHQLLADSQRDARAWRTRFEALEERTRTAERVAEASGDVPRILHVACPESLAQGSGRTLSVLVSPGTIRSGPLILTGRWSQETAASSIELSPPYAPTMHVRLPLRAPDTAGGHELILHLGANGSDGAPAWRGTITVRPLYGATYRAEVPARLPAADAVVVPVYVTERGDGGLGGPGLPPLLPLAPREERRDRPARRVAYVSTPRRGSGRGRLPPRARRDAVRNGEL
jgi:hypothetical protein